MSDVPGGPGWWRASDGKWYAPEPHPAASSPASAGHSSAGDAVFPAAGDAVFPAAGDAVFPAAGDAVFPAAASDQLFPAAAQQPAEDASSSYPRLPEVSGDATTSKSRLTAGLLAIFLGWLGVHRFYLGYKWIGVIMLLLTVLSLGALVPATLVWGVVEGILILARRIKTDKSGAPLR